MKTKYFLSVLCVSSAVFALPATAQTPDGLTPAQETVCDKLSDATPGLYGLCVAFCEAQDCEATMGPDGVVTFDPSCKPSAPKLLENYYKKAGPSDPDMPCVKVPCPCWSEGEINNIAGSQSAVFPDRCYQRDGAFTGIIGLTTDETGVELAYAYEAGPRCVSMATDWPNVRDISISAEQFETCQKSILNECGERGVNVSR